MITTLNGLPWSWDSFIRGMCARRKWLLSKRLREWHTQEDDQLVVREKKMGRSSSYHSNKIPQAMRNMKNSTLEEPLIHISIWIRNNAIMNEKDDEAEGSRRSLPMKQIKISIQLSFHDIVFVMHLFIFSWWLMSDKIVALMIICY